MNPHLRLDQPSPWVTRFAALIPDGEVLDLACGGGRHARFLAGMGHPVVAVDRDADALQSLAGQGISTLQVDLEATAGDDNTWPFASDRFAGIVVTNYLHRPLFPFILDSLAPGGVLIYETFAHGNAQFGKPSNPDFLLEPAELLQLVQVKWQHTLHVIAYEDGYIDVPKPAMVQRICALKTDSGILPSNLRLV